MRPVHKTYVYGKMAQENITPNL